MIEEKKSSFPSHQASKLNGLDVEGKITLFGSTRSDRSTTSKSAPKMSVKAVLWDLCWTSRNLLAMSRDHVNECMVIVEYFIKNVFL